MGSETVRAEAEKARRTKLVTVAIPVFKRFDFLSKAIQSVASQDYPNIELMVSDNGMNGSRVPELVRQSYARPFRFRQNPVSVPIVTHFNQLVREASGEYYLVLCDDDEISANYVSELVGILESNPRVTVAIAKQEVIEPGGHIIRTSSDQLPEQLTGEEFVQLWCTREHGFKTWVTFLGRTSEIRDCGGMLETPHGTHADDALILKLCLGSRVAFNPRCAFRNRSYDESSGYACGWRELAEDTDLFLRFLDSDPTICRFAGAQADQWAKVKKQLVKMTWETYHGRWAGVYRKRLSRPSWLRAAFAMPFMPDYYCAVLRTLISVPKAAVAAQIKRLFPWGHKMYRALRYTGGI